MQDNRENDLLKKAMAAVNKTRSAVENRKDECHGKESHDNDIEIAVYDELDKAYAWLDSEEAETGAIKEAIPVFTSIEKIRDYVSKTDLPNWEYELFRNEIDALFNEWVDMRSLYTGEAKRDIMDWATKEHPTASQPMEQSFDKGDPNQSHENDNDVEVKIHVHDKDHVAKETVTDEINGLMTEGVESEINRLLDGEVNLNLNLHDSDNVRYTPALPKNLLNRLRSMQEKQAPVTNVDEDHDKDSQAKPLTKDELNTALGHAKDLIRRMDDLRHGFIDNLNPEPKSTTTKDHVRSHNVGQSDYSKHKIQPWDIWEEYNLNPWDADIVKRILRTKNDGRPPEETRIEDYRKIIHVAQERIRQIETNGHV